MGNVRGIEEEQIRPCKGPCGRMTRPSRWTLEDAPNTISRTDGSYCSQCRRVVLGESQGTRYISDDERQKTVASLEQYMEKRRARIAKNAPQRNEAFTLRVLG